MALCMGLLRAVSPAMVHLLTAPWPFLPYQCAPCCQHSNKTKNITAKSRLLHEIFGCDMTLPSPAPSSRQRAYSEHKYLCLPLLFLSKLVLFLPVIFFFSFLLWICAAPRGPCCAEQQQELPSHCFTRVRARHKAAETSSVVVVARVTH